MTRLNPGLQDHWRTLYPLGQMLYRHLQHHNDTIINRRTQTSLTKYLPLTLFVRVRKGYSRFACERELETEQKLQYFDPSLLWPSRCVFLVLLLSASSLDPNSSGLLEGPFGRVWLSLPHLVYNWNSNSTGLTPVLTELYNSSTPTWSPTRSFKSHVSSSSSGNNCHAIQRSLSSGASVYESIMEFFSSSHFISQFPPTRFPLITATRMSHFLPVHHLEWHFGPGRRSQYNTKSRYPNSDI